jgi:eukaryotic-like serine/threonine-protein kinase
VVRTLAYGRLNAHHALVHGNGSARFQFGPVTLIPDERLVLKDGRVVSFTPKAFDLLAVLAANPGRLLTKEHLMQAVWPDTIVEESNLAYHVFAIRKALGEGADAERYIETVPKSGYRFVAPVVRVESDGRALSGPPAAPTATVPETDAADLSSAGATDRRSAAEDATTSSSWASSRRSWTGPGAGLALAALIILGLGLRRDHPGPTESVRFQEAVTGRLAETGMFSVSPDGRQLVFAAEGADGILQLWARNISTIQPVALPGTEVFTIIPPVVWSPDSRFVGFDPGGVLKKVSLDGGATQTVCELPATAVGGSWNAQGDILLGNAFGGLVRCPASGGRSAVVTAANVADGERHLFPSFLSDGRRFLYLRTVRSNPEASGIYAGALGGEPAPPNSRLITTGFGAVFVAAADSGPGVIVFARDRALFAQRFDESQLQVIGEPIRLADGIGSYLDGAFFAVSPTTLVYRDAEPDSQLTWFDRQGREVQRIGRPARFSSLALSPGGDRAVVATAAPQGTPNQDLWLFDLARTAIPRRITFGSALEFWPVWSSNDRFVFGSSGGQSGIYEQTVAGEPRLLLKTAGPENPTSMSADGRILLYTTITQSATRGDVWVRAGEGAAATPQPFLHGEKDQWQAQLSPDSRWVAYVSNETGPNDVFVAEVRSDPATKSVTAGEKVRISEGGGFSPRWRRDGRELFYLTADGSVMSVAIETTPHFRPGAVQRLFKIAGVIPEWGVTHDGSRFLFAVPLSPPPPFNFVRDWQAALRRQR